MSSFVHLHTHSEYSMLLGACRIKDILSKVDDLKQTAVALTDHGSMFGILEFFTHAKKMGIKPIIGCDFYVAPDDCRNQEYKQDEPLYHKLTLLAKDLIGYKNLLKLCSTGYLEGYCQKPRIDKKELTKNSQGLICLANNLQGEIGYHLLRDEEDSALELLKFYQDTFGQENVYLSLQDHGVEQEKKLNQIFLDWHHNKDCQLVAVNDCHYLNPMDSQAHGVLLCIGEGYKIDDPNRLQFPSDQYHIRSSEEMIGLFSSYPKAIENTVHIAEQCNVEIEFGKLYWPTCPIPPEYNSNDDYLNHLSQQGLAKKYKDVTPELQKRLDYELAIMKKMEVAGYMLIVQDFIMAAKEKGIPVGPGRGSAVGSLVSYVIGITDVDPIRFNLLFERFLNPERVSMPDIDTDFSDLDRGKIIQYVVEKYGKESVAQIVTYGRMKAKMVLRDVGRVLGFEAQDINFICKQFPADDPFADLKKAIETSPPLKKALEESPETQRLLDISFKLEGFVRQAGMHAAAVIIAPQPVVNFAPLFKQPGAEQIMIQYDKQYSEDIGLLKMDFLGLRNLSVIQECIQHIKNEYDITIQPLELPENDEKTLDLLGKGQTTGVFQFESGGMQDYLRKLKPTGIEDLIAMNALYRPGPIENIPQFINRKNGNEAIDCFHPNLESILGETYGVIVYQEQVMQIAQTLSGFTLGGADEMRRAMAKKNVEKMDKLKPKFINGAEENGYDRKIAENIWDILVPFSSYAFNKSHSAAYATISYQTAYLKAHYPAQFLAANMSSELNNTERLVILLNDCRQLKINVIGPNVNVSQPKFISEGNQIVYGLGGIKNVGVGAAQQILEENKRNGPYKSIFDLCQRVDGSNLNRRAIESLIFAGAMDDLIGNRAQQYAAVEPAMALAAKKQKDKDLGQTTLFDVFGESNEEQDMDETLPADVDAWPYSEMLGKEKEVLGLFLSGHPLEPYRMEIDAFSASRLDSDSLSQKAIDKDILLGGILTSMRVRISQKTNRSFAFGFLEDFYGKIEVIFWADAYEKLKELAEVDAMLLIKGKLQRDAESGTYKLVAERALPIDQAREKMTRNVNIKLSTIGLQKDNIDKIHALAQKNEGYCYLTFNMDSTVVGQQVIRSNNLKVSASKSFTTKLEKLLDPDSVWLSRT